MWIVEWLTFGLNSVFGSFCLFDNEITYLLPLLRDLPFELTSDDMFLPELLPDTSFGLLSIVAVTI